MKEHLDLAALDAVRTGEASEPEAAHARDCAECAAAMAEVTRVADRLGGAPTPIFAVPPLVRQRILAEARRRPAPMRWMAAAAAMLVAVFGLWLAIGRSPDQGPMEADDAGRVDIVDAYALALRLKSGEPVDSKWDINGDGRVDDGDVDAIGRRAVSVDRRGG